MNNPMPTPAELANAKLGFDKHPTSFAEAYTYGALLLVSGRPQEARAPLTTASQSIDDAKADASELLATALMQLNEMQAAAEAWSEVVRKRPKDEAALTSAALTWTRVGAIDKALVYKRRLAARRNDAASWGDLGATLAREGMHKEALQAFEAATVRDATFLEKAPYEASMWQKSLAAEAEGAPDAR